MFVKKIINVTTNAWKKEKTARPTRRQIVRDVALFSKLY